MENRLYRSRLVVQHIFFYFYLESMLTKNYQWTYPEKSTELRKPRLIPLGNLVSISLFSVSLLNENTKQNLHSVCEVCGAGFPASGCYTRIFGFNFEFTYLLPRTPFAQPAQLG